MVGSALVAGAMVLGNFGDYGGKRVEGGIIEVSTSDRSGVYGGYSAFFGNLEGGEEGFDNYEEGREFNSIVDLEIYSNEPGFKADTNAKPINTFGWLFNLGAGNDIVGADNYLKFQVNDSNNLPGLVAYDLANPSVRYSIATDGSRTEVNIANPLDVSAGEYAQWRMDIVQPFHQLSIDFQKNIGGEWVSGSEPFVVSYGDVGGTSARDDIIDVPVEWVNGFNDTSSGEFGLYSIESPFTYEKLSTDSREFGNLESVFVEPWHNDTDRDGGRLILEVLTGDKNFFNGYTLKQLQPGSFTEDLGSITLGLDDLLDEEGKGAIDFDSWNSTQLSNMQIYFNVGPYGGFELIPDGGEEFVVPNDQAFVIGPGTYAVGTPYVQEQASMRAIIPEPSVLAMIGSGVLAGLGLLFESSSRLRAFA